MLLKHIKDDFLTCVPNKYMLQSVRLMEIMNSTYCPLSISDTADILHLYLMLDAQYL